MAPEEELRQLKALGHAKVRARAAGADHNP
jgi:hypothetical protein